MQSWDYITMLTEGESFALGPVDNIWAHRWTRVPGLRVQIRHPQYPDQSYEAGVEEIEVGGVSVRFVCYELSNGVYGIFAPSETA